MRRNRRKCSRAWLYRGSGILAGILCLAAGVWLGQAESVWIKGIYICLECIGIG